MTAPRVRLPPAGPLRTAVLRAARLVTAAALAGGALLAMAPGTAPQASPPRPHVAAGPRHVLMISLDTNGAGFHSAGRIAAERQAAGARSASRASAAPQGVRAAASAGRHWPLALIGVLASVFAALTVIGVLLIGLLQRDRGHRLLTERIAGYAAGQQPARQEGGGTVARATVGWIGRLLRSGRTEKRLAERLDLAGIASKPAEWVLLGVIAGLLLAAVLTVVTGSFLVGVPSGALLGWLGMRLAVSVRISRRRAAFAEQLPDLLQFVAGSLYAGFSLAQALDAAVREGASPASSEFTRALSQTRIGVDLTAALERVGDRMESADLQWTVMAIRIQRQVGGHLAEVLTTTVATMRERAQLRRQVKALSAEGRLSAYILVAMPVLIGGWLFLTSPTYMRPLYTTPIGLAMLVATTVLIVVGALWMRKVIKVEV